MTKWISMILAIGMIGAGPTTTPTTKTSESNLRQIIQSLQQQIAKVKEENESLRSELAALQKTPKNQSIVVRAFNLKRGMTQEQAIKTMGREPGNPRTIAEENALTISWQVGNDLGNRIEVRFEAGKLESIRFIIRSLSMDEMN